MAVQNQTQQFNRSNKLFSSTFRVEGSGCVWKGAKQTIVVTNTGREAFKITYKLNSGAGSSYGLNKGNSVIISPATYINISAENNSQIACGHVLIAGGLKDAEAGPKKLKAIKKDPRQTKSKGRIATKNQSRKVAGSKLAV